VTAGSLLAIHVAAARGEPTRSIEEALVVVGRGIEGDRNAAAGRAGGNGREVTLIEVEAIEAVKLDDGIELAPGDARRNLVTRGVALNHLVGRTLRVGGALLRGVRLCEPCAYLEGLTKPGVRLALVHRGGLRADVVEGGTIRVGDPIEALPD